MSATAARLLRAAAEIVGGRRALAERLGIAESLLARYMAGTRLLPDPLLLRTVDVILEDRRYRPLPQASGFLAAEGGGE
jgi:transcriptional regulator with XRE-family HTH domain